MLGVDKKEGEEIEEPIATQLSRGDINLESIPEPSSPDENLKESDIELKIEC